MGYRLKGLEVSDGRIRACGTERFSECVFKLKCECYNRVQQKEEVAPGESLPQNGLRVICRRLSWV
jgi:hypothetical protein